MPRAVRFLPRHPASIVLLATAMLATASVFVFARPQYHPRYESVMVDFSRQHYYSPAVVRRAFAAQGIRLRHPTRVGSSILWLSTTDPPSTHGLSVMVGPRTGHGSWGPKLEAYDERFGNLLVTYGGSDEHRLERIKAAVASLR